LISPDAAVVGCAAGAKREDAQPDQIWWYPRSSIPHSPFCAA
jgi:hypothetical protein